MKNKLLFAIIAVLILIGVLLIVADLSPRQMQPIMNTSVDGNFILDVGINSCNRDYTGPVNIKVYIDGKLAVNQRFQEARVCLPSVEKFRFYLSNGTHEIRAEAKGVTQLKENFEINNTKYASLFYSYPPFAKDLPAIGRDDRGFSFNVFDEPIMYE